MSEDDDKEFNRPFDVIIMGSGFIESILSA